jgi:hypothetical protein
MDATLPHRHFLLAFDLDGNGLDPGTAQDRGATSDTTSWSSGKKVMAGW